VCLTEASLVLREISGDRSVDISRSQVPGTAWVQRHLGRSFLHVMVPKRLSLEAPAEFVRLFDAWRGPLAEQDLRAALKRRLGWTIPIGALWVVLSLPSQQIPFDAIGFMLGSIAMVLGLLRLVWTSRTLFLFDMLWFFALALDIVLDVREGTGWFWLIVAAVSVLVGIGSLREYDRFESVAGVARAA
jgi:hypothetical protein